MLACLQPSPVSSSAAYRASLRGLNALANRVAGVVQSGSLPMYLGVILLTAAAVPGALLVTRHRGGRVCPTSSTPRCTSRSRPSILGAAVAAAGSAPAVHGGLVPRRRRLLRWPGLFVIQGAPDLALTQVAIESLTTVLFVLVLRRLPDRFESRDAAVAAFDPVRASPASSASPCSRSRWRPGAQHPPTPTCRTR